MFRLSICETGLHSFGVSTRSVSKFVYQSIPPELPNGAIVVVSPNGIRIAVD